MRVDLFWVRKPIYFSIGNVADDTYSCELYYSDTYRRPKHQSSDHRPFPTSLRLSCTIPKHMLIFLTVGITSDASPLFGNMLTSKPQVIRHNNNILQDISPSFRPPLSPDSLYAVIKCYKPSTPVGPLVTRNRTTQGTYQWCIRCTPTHIVVF